MPRVKRKESATKIYNVAIKGANSQAMFYDDDDREKFIKAIDDACKNCDVRVAARVLMGNHVHLVVHAELDNMARFFKSLGASYVYYFNQKYGRTGPLWNARYYSDPVEEIEAYMQVSAYIFNNPVAAKIAETPLVYAWSNYRALVSGLDARGREAIEEVGDADEILAYALDYSEAKAKENCEFRLEIVPKARVGDVDLIEFIKDFLGAKSVANVANETEETQRSLLENLLDLGSNIGQMSRVTSISRGRIVSLLA